MKRLIFRSFILMVSIAYLASCAEVKPWQKENLAKPEMQFGDQTLSDRIKSHTYFSKESAHGGTGSSSGGCGCN
ncbi:DUF4266 domain-containing protein [Motiliproteus sp. MSK22-1]|uniref:DUF4266 domain-containing protein n=1 Tax=Motiliproteus sp. MSK22-1 TaxID=1897630 RepID=UPI0009767BFA|nr:DUF4266 domain-containing protein [Motiliproteus sp. MSK22-1]OMH38050.1 hypothetical protein BGP75_07140 [Motiliproteus sp. MSK22-1]